jgi:hypothetical protein
MLLAMVLVSIVGLAVVFPRWRKTVADIESGD